MNQQLAENRQRRFPFVQDAALPFADSLLVGLRAVLSQRFGTCTLRLSSLGNVAGFCELWFDIISTDLPGYGLWVGFLDTSPSDMRVLLELQTSFGVAHPELGYGFAFIGDPAAVPATTSGLALDIDPSCLRVHANGQPMTLRVANLVRPGPSSCAETPGAASTLTLLDRIAEVVPGCVEVTTAPNVLQTTVQPTVTGETTLDEAVPLPLPTHTRYADGAVTAITTNEVTIQDAIPAAPAWDAVVDGNPLVAEPVLAAGHNVRLSGSLSDNLVRIGYRLGAGLGTNCVDVKGYPSLGRLAVDCVKSINGVHGRELTLNAGTGLALIADPAGHRILILVNAEDLRRAST